MEEWITEIKANGFIDFCEFFEIPGYQLLFFNRNHIGHWDLDTEMELTIYSRDNMTLVFREKVKFKERTAAHPGNFAIWLYNEKQKS